MSCPPPKAAALSSTSPSSTQRSFTVAVVVTIMCLPLLLLDLVWAGDSGAPTLSEVSAEVTVAPALAAAASSPPPSSEAPPSSSVPAAVPTTVAPKVAAAGAPAKRSVAPVTTKPPVWTPPPTTAAPAPPPPIVSGSDAALLACVRSRESGGNYAIVDGSGNYMGAYQYSQSTWDGIASRAGRPDLVGVRPNTASPADQDAIAYATLAISGRSPWGGICG